MGPPGRTPPFSQRVGGKSGRGGVAGRARPPQSSIEDSGASPARFGCIPVMHPLGRSWLLLSGFVLFYVIYLLFGGLVFSSLERPVEEQLRREVDALKRRFLNQSCVTAASLDHFVSQVLAANRYGVAASGNASSDPSNWDLTSAMFFANTLVTTVGYGHTTPLSTAGKIFSIVYALLGVPFTMLVLTACVQRLMYPLVAAPLGQLQRCGLEARPAAGVHFLSLLALVLLCLFAAPAAVFSIVEDGWSFLDGFYFCFISLCTIGLGDLVPAARPQQEFKQVYQVAVMVYLFLGLMMMYLLLRAFHKMADLHGLTTYLQLPRCEVSDPNEDRRPIVENGGGQKRPSYNSVGDR
ncbi:potassium channel subfamily K member 6-like [Corythoichthys intestinalis]|uniref:potassium channel subfamily K member 6-like n=1 Tax=Corythoichthys intestinalis TaxID=161448 RepID=UPI0025A67369|nr:potassium channel subfamily K member 6-like [Corythoichthys intestinalis]